MEPIAVKQLVADLVCPVCGAEGLEAGADAVACRGCGARHPVRSGVVDFVREEALGPGARREHAANAVALDARRAVRRRIAKGRGNALLTAQTQRAMAAVARIAGDIPPGATLVSVGSGSGYELSALLERRPFARVYSSDLAWSATALVPHVTQALDGPVGLFAADFEHLPIRRGGGHVGFAFLALHHADDPHRVLDGMLERSFDELVLVEPVTNPLVELLARAGLAKRVEYSGLRPQWLELPRLRRIAEARGCTLRVETWWEVPRSRLPRRLRRHPHAWKPLFWLVEAVSRATRPLGVGSMAAVRFSRPAR